MPEAEKPAEAEEAPAAPGEAGRKLIEFFGRLKKALKTIALYRHNTAGYREYLRPAFQSLGEALEGTAGISLAVEQNRFCWHRQPVYEEEISDQNLAFLLFRDGVRLLNFRAGLTEKELLDLVMCFLQEAEMRKQGLDLVSLLWQQQFQHLEYVVVDSFALGTADAESNRQEVDRIISYLVSRLSTVEGEGQQFARLKLDDLELEIEDVQQATGLKLAKAVFSEEEKQALQREISEFEKRHLSWKLEELLLEALRADPAQEIRESLKHALHKLFDTLLLVEDLPTLDRLLLGLQEVLKGEHPPASQALARELAQEFKHRLAEPTTIERLGDMLEERADQERSQRILRYFMLLGPEGCEGLLQLLERLNRPEARALVCEALLRLGKDKIPLFAARLHSPKPNLVRDMMQLLARLHPPDFIEQLANVLTHPNLALRMDALRAISSSGHPAAGVILSRALSDPEAQVRTAAAALLPNFDPQLAKRTLLPLARDAAFADRPDREQAAVFGALGQLDDEEVREFMRQTLHATGLLGRRRQETLKKNLVSGLAAAATLPAFRFLKSELERGIKPPELAAAVERACQHLKKTLLKEKNP